MPFQVEMLSKAEVEAIWKNRARAEDFAAYVNFLNLRDVGDGFRVIPEKGEKNAESARSIKHNFNEAAKERGKAQHDAAGKIVVKDGAAVLVTPATLDPVIIRWKSITHDEKRKVKNVDTDVTVIDKLEALIVAAGDVRPRGPRVETEVVAVNATDEQKAAKAVLLPDGRTAKLTPKGVWRAPKVTAPVAQNGAANVPANGTDTASAETAKSAA